MSKTKMPPGEWDNLWQEYTKGFEKLENKDKPLQFEPGSWY